MTLQCPRGRNCGIFSAAPISRSHAHPPQEKAFPLSCGSLVCSRPGPDKMLPCLGLAFPLNTGNVINCRPGGTFSVGNYFVSLRCLCSGTSGCREPRGSRNGSHKYRCGWLTPPEKGGPFMRGNFSLQTYARLLSSTQSLEGGGRKGKQAGFACSFKSFLKCSAEKAYNAILKLLLFHGKQANNS